MPGPPVTLGTSVQCPHGAPAFAPPTQVAALAGGTPLLSAAAVYTVPVCPVASQSPPNACATVRFQPMPRVLLKGVPALVATPGAGLAISAVAAPNGPVITLGGAMTVNLLG